MTSNDRAATPRRRVRHRRCRYCSALGTWTSPISARGMCEECGARRLEDSIVQQRDKKGWVYQRWALAMVRVASEAMGVPVLVRLPNEMPENPGQSDVNTRNLA